MSYAPLNVLSNDTEVYSHVLDTESDETLLLDSVGRTIYTVDSGGVLFSRSHSRVGKFYLDNNHNWYFEEDKMDGSLVTFNSTDLIKCEYRLFKDLVKSL